MRILLFGKNGQLGWELQRSLAPLGEVIALGSNDSPFADFTQSSAVASTARGLAPDIIVNAAAYTAVDRAETEVHKAMTVNAVTPGILAEVAADLGAWMVHYSTDYVFDGTGMLPWRETDLAKPLSAYGISKLAGEDNIRSSGCRHLIFRTSWVYAARGQNFVKTIIRYAQQRETLRVINDQFGAPTGAELLADVTGYAIRSAMLSPELSGTYHIAAAGETTWYDYACHVIMRARAAGVPIRVADASIQPVTASDFPTPARRPANSRLNTHKIRSAFGLYLPPWQSGVDRMLSEIIQRNLE